MKFLVVISLVIMATNAMAGGTGGNGGVSVVCRNKVGKIDSAQVLDIYEGEERYGRKYDNSLDADTKIELAQLKLANHPGFLRMFQEELAKVRAIIFFVREGNRLILTNDAFPKIEKVGCGFEQLANYTDETELLVSQEIHDELDEVNKAALLVHETIYTIFRKTRNAKDSQLSRKLTAQLLAKNADQKVIDAIIGGGTIGTQTASQILGPLAFIPAGTFMMGSPSYEEGRSSDEAQRQVTISKNFEMMKTEVTQEMWVKVMGKNPSYFQSSSDCPQSHKVVSGVSMCPNFPVEMVSYNDVTDFINKLNSREGSIFRLPTEAEWEYAARAGSKSAYTFGERSSVLHDYAWFSENSGSGSREVGVKKANKFELYDMHGNVLEWVQDWYTRFPTGSIDPISYSGGHRVIRGGSWFSDASGLRSSYRFSDSPSHSLRYIGFRLVRTLPNRVSKVNHWDVFWDEQWLAPVPRR